MFCPHRGLALCRSSLLIVLGLPLFAFLFLAGWDLGLLFSQLANLADHYRDADAIRRIAFSQDLQGVFLATSLGVLLARAPPVFKAPRNGARAACCPGDRQWLTRPCYNLLIAHWRCVWAQFSSRSASFFRAPGSAAKWRVPASRSSPCASPKASRALLDAEARSGKTPEDGQRTNAALTSRPPRRPRTTWAAMAGWCLVAEAAS